MRLESVKVVLAMKCIEKIELEQFLKGKLTPERMLEIDGHLDNCEQCKKLLARLSARVEFGAELIGAIDCPEYEELSAYVDESLPADHAKAICIHANLCEFCARDINRITELRSHATLREKVTVHSGMTLQTRRRGFAYWKHALIAASLGGITAVALFLSNPSVPVINKSVPVVAKAPAVTDTKPVTVTNPPVAKPVAIEKIKPAIVATNKKPISAPVAVIKDGAYAVVAKNGELSLTTKSGKSVRTALEARIAASIDEKLRTGKIKPAKTVLMAMASIAVRSNDGVYDASPTAPKQVFPIGKVLMSAKPTLSWSLVDLSESYRVRVYDSAGNIVAEQTSDSSKLTLTNPLERGEVYSWRVGVRFGETDGWVESAAAKFAVLSQEKYNDIQRVKTMLPGSHLALGAAYESAGLYDEAAEEYRMLRRENPNSKLAKKLLHGAARR